MIIVYLRVSFSVSQRFLTIFLFTFHNWINDKKGKRKSLLKTSKKEEEEKTYERNGKKGENSTKTYLKREKEDLKAY